MNPLNPCLLAVIVPFRIGLTLPSDLWQAGLVKPENWNRLSYEQRRTIAVGLFHSGEGQGLLREALCVAAHYYGSAGQLSKADDLVLIGEVLFPGAESSLAGNHGD